ncbi:MAG TPA: trifunctional transcriptional activator/DNA repair protein Ada/methylated-DNA--[protein]-cysteine S-methyltransferase, partial [Gemmatimonadota bacterium]|nr:trifunctional transcriptional activator/DNA repair protein Ada/methylated-DNA--[protein]-cysteine S-methyltransferase [Gemmatimonadota bacterium]
MKTRKAMEAQATLPLLPPRDEMLRAVEDRDRGYDGLFYTAVRTTGIFCRPSCPARKPNPENIEFFGAAREALFAGYRPCKRCRPLEMGQARPDWVRRLLDAVERDPEQRLKEGDLRAMGLDPSTVRRWFVQHHGMTFHAYQRGLRLGRALRHIASGDEIGGAAYANGYESLSGFYTAIRKLTGRPPGASRDALVVRLTRIATPLGPMLAGATDEALCLLEFVDRRMLETQLGRLARALECVLVPGDNPVLEETATQVAEYFEGERREFTVPLDVRGSSFQRAVWEGLREIPYGETRSYAEQAARLGRPDAVRAVARANGDNRIAIVIP